MKIGDMVNFILFTLCQSKSKHKTNKLNVVKRKWKSH